MNEPDLLTAASAALRDERLPADPASTRMRLLGSLVRRRQRGRLRTWAATLTAGVLLGSTAMAFWTGALGAWLGIAPGARQQPHARAMHTWPPNIAQLQAPTEAQPMPAPAAPAARPAVSTLKRHAANKTIPTATTTLLKNVPLGAEPARDAALEQQRYETAHHAHFVIGDAQAALAAWDAYLAYAPDGRFALEARYNRALCLVRLQRWQEAQDALAPFASGAHGNYRRKEASALLSRIVLRLVHNVRSGAGAGVAR